MTNLWTQDILKIKTALGDQMRLVGGCVRDFILNKEPDDIDIATPLPIMEVSLCLKKHGIQSKIIAPRHGVIMAILGKTAYEITTLRREIYSDENHEHISFITDYEEDSFRRDFTMNALYMDSDNTIYDYHNGLEDLKNKQVRFIGNPFERIKQDPLRILRYLRFWGNFGGDKPDKSVLECFTDLKDGLKNISRGRKQKEIEKIIKSKRCLEIITVINDFGLWPFIAPNSNKPITLLTSKEILTQI